LLNISSGNTHFTEVDIDFLIGEVAPQASNKIRLRQMILEEQEFRQAIVADERVFQRVISDAEVMVKLSPTLYFEILLRKASKELDLSAYTLERIGKETIPVFDTSGVTELMGQPRVLEYLAQMLASFTVIESQVRRVRVRRGTWRRILHNDMDIDSLVQLCSAADEENRLGYYKRIADVCLLVSSVFQEHSYFGEGGGQSTFPSSRRMRRSMEDYEWEGKRFYRLAESHPAARLAGLSDIFGVLREQFIYARKPLRFIASHYLQLSSGNLFGSPPQ
jgi:hypothetical protein